MKHNTEVLFILNLLEKYLSTSPSVKVMDTVTGKVKEHGDSFEDLADYLPFILYYKNKSLFKKEISKTITYLKNNNYLYVKEDKFPLNLFSRSYAQSDLLFGLILATFEDKKYLVELEKCAMAWYYSFFKNDAMFILRREPFFKKNIPKLFNIHIKIISSEDFGMFIELFCLIYEVTKNDKYLKIGYEIYKKLKDKKNVNFFPFYFSRSMIGNSLLKLNIFSKRKNEFQLIKQNSNTLFGILRLVKNSNNTKIKEEFKSYIDFFLNNFYDSKKGVFYTNYNLVNKKKGSDLTVFHFIELLIESSFIFPKENYVEIAKKLIYTILSSQDKKTGLIPFISPNVKQDLKRFNIKSNVSWLDAEVDFMVSALRFYEISKDDFVYKSIKKLHQGIIKYHKQEYGYCSEINILSGKVSNPMYSTKMLALVLKSFIVLENIGNLNDGSHKSYYILQDR